MDGDYDVAQICLNGHVTNARVRSDPQSCADYCEECGAKTIQTCPRCGSPIRGQLDNWSDHLEAPAFCIACGEPFPWTEARVQAAIELAEELDALDEKDRDLLKKSLDDLLAETPRTQVAATRFKKLMVKAGKVGAEAFRQVLLQALCEAAKKVIWGQ